MVLETISSIVTMSEFRLFGLRTTIQLNSEMCCNANFTSTITSHKPKKAANAKENPV